MKLYDNPETKIIFASDAEQDAAMQEITADQIAGLVAQGYIVDSSAQSFAPGVASSSGEGASASSMPTSESLSTAATVAPTDTATSAASEGDTPLTPGSSASVSPAATGSTAEVTQVGGQQVVTGLTQSENSLAGSGPVTDNQLANTTPTVDGPALDGDSKTFANVENDLNPLVPAAGTEGAPASQLAAAAAEPEAEPLPRESHLMLMEHKFAALMAKARNEERILIQDVEAIYDHVKAVL